MLFIRSTDDRNRPVRVRFSGLKPAAGVWWERVRARPRLENARIAVAVVKRPSTWLVFAAASLVGVLVSIFAHDGPMGLGMLVLTPIAAPLLMVAIVAIRTGIWIAGAASDSAEAAMLQRGLCPACGYSLIGLEGAEDQRVECPECGSAWRCVRIGPSGSSEPEVFIIKSG